VSPSEVMLLKQVSNDRSFAHAAEELQTHTSERIQKSTVCLDIFYLLVKFSGIDC